MIRNCPTSSTSNMQFRSSFCYYTRRIQLLVRCSTMIRPIKENPMYDQQAGRRYYKSFYNTISSSSSSTFAHLQSSTTMPMLVEIQYHTRCKQHGYDSHHLQQQQRRYLYTRWTPLTNTDNNTSSTEQPDDDGNIPSSVSLPIIQHDDEDADSENAIGSIEQDHGYVEVPDGGPRISPLDHHRIHELLLQRTRCMTSLDLTQVRVIDEMLEKSNIYVDDVAKQWRADGKPFTTYARRNSHVNHEQNQQQNTHKSQEELAIEEDRREYRLFPYKGPKMKFISETDIHTLLAERSTYRRRKDFTKADKIRQTLESYGVFLDDRHKVWKGDDGYKVSLQKHNYTMSKDSGPLKSNITEEAIHDLLNKRFRCRLRKDYKGAQRIYEKLTNCGVSIDEELLEWRADGVQFSKFLRRHEYKLAYDAGPSSKDVSVSDTEKHELLSKHWSYKQARDMKNADKVWQQLSNAGIFLDVTSMEWRADGIKHNYRLSSDAGPNISKLSDKIIHTLLEKRMLARWTRDFETSDRIRNRLKSDGVYIDDDKKEWRADGKRHEQHCHQYIKAPNSDPITTSLSEPEIHELLSELWEMKLTQDYKEADRVSDKLFDAGVYYSDETKQWRADGKTCNYKLFHDAGPYKGALDETKVHRLLEKSFRLRLRKEFDAANVIHEELMNAEIHIDQNKNLWRGDGIMHSYKMTAGAGPNTSLLLVNDIHKLIAERWRYKREQEFENADRVYVELRDNGVYVDDEVMQWRADGIYHTYQKCTDSGPNNSSLSDNEIHRLLGRRMHHKKFQNFVRADQVVDYLRAAKVFINDETREWRADGIPFPKRIQQKKSKHKSSSGQQQQQQLRTATTPKSQVAKGKK